MCIKRNATRVATRSTAKLPGGDAEAASLDSKGR
jgi:hypothetical protein